MIISIPAMDLDAAPISSPTQKILPVNLFPLASPRILSKSAPEFSEILIILVHEPVFERPAYISTTLELSSYTHVRLLTRSLLYTQTTSSYL